MLTTAGFNCSATSANETTAGDSPAAARVRTGITGALGAEIAGCGVRFPAKISPMRNAMVAVRQTVTTTNRRVIRPIITLLDQLEEAGFFQHRDSERLRLFRLATGLGAHNHSGRLLAYRIDDFGAKTLERRRRLLA